MESTIKSLPTPILAQLLNNKPSKLLKILKDFKAVSFKRKINGKSTVEWSLDSIHPYMFNAINNNAQFNTIEDCIKYYEEVTINKPHREKKKKEEEMSAKKKKFLKEQEERLSQIKEISSIVLEKVTDIWFTKRKTKYIIHAGATNSGKTYNSIQSLMKARSGVYLAPLRLLAWEIYEKISAVRPCNLKTGEERIDNRADITSCTIEMLNYNTYYDCVVIDEAFMLSDKDRGKSWLKAIMEVNADEVHIISSLDSLELIKTILTNTERSFEVNTYERKTPLEVSEETFKMRDVQDKTVFVVFSRIKCIQTKEFFDSKNIPCSILYGNLPPEVKKNQIEKFINGETKICVSTDVIGMGVNLPCDHVVFIDTTKFDGDKNRPLNAQEVKQISGRAGRYLLSDKGTVHATEKAGLKHIKETIVKPFKNTKSFYEINYDILSMIKMQSLYERIKLYSELKFIPTELAEIVEIEDAEKYLVLASDLNLERIAKYDLELAWNLIKLPVKETNERFWSYLVKQIHNKEEILIDPFINFGGETIADQTELAEVEAIISMIDLLLNIKNNRFFTNYLVDIYLEDLVDYKYVLIEKIDMFLLNKKSFAKKGCITCGDPIHISSSHKYCDDCFEEMKPTKDFHTKYF